MTKKRKDELNKKQTFTNVEVGTILESLETQIGSISAGHDFLARKLNTFDKRFDWVDKRFDLVDERFVAVDKRFDLVDERFVAVDKRFDKMDKRFDKMDKRFDKMDARISTLENKVDSGQLANNVRFEELEKKLEVLHIDLVKIEDTLTRKADKDVFELLKQRVGGLEARMAKRK